MALPQKVRNKKGSELFLKLENSSDPFSSIDKISDRAIETQKRFASQIKTVSKEELERIRHGEVAPNGQVKRDELPRPTECLAVRFEHLNDILSPLAARPPRFKEPGPPAASLTAWFCHDESTCQLLRLNELCRLILPDLS